MKFQLFFLKKSKRRLITYLILTILFCFFVTSIPVNAGLFGEKIKKISDNELKEVIKVELNLPKYPNFYSYTDSMLKEALDKEINSQEIPGLTFGSFILNALYEEKLIEMCYPYFDDKESSLFFSKLADNLSDWQKNFGSKTTKLALQGVIEAFLKMPKLGIGTSTLFLAIDLVQINVAIAKLAKVIARKALFYYLTARYNGDSHDMAWGEGIPPLYDTWQTESFFQSLWNKYGEAILSDNLVRFKEEQHEILRELILQALNQPPNLPTNMIQFKSDGKAILKIGKATTEKTVILKTKVSDPDGNKARLQIELRRLDEYEGKFDEEKGGLQQSDLFENNSEVMIPIYGLADGDYHWRARAIDEYGLSSKWVSFGGNPDSAIDFSVGQEVITPIITSPLKITSDSPYYVEDTINAEFAITNKDSLPIIFSVLTVGGRDPDDQVTDFTHRQNITIEPSQSYNYKGTLTLNKVGDYHFFCTYQAPDGNWNTNVDLGSGLADEDRIEDISVEEKEKLSIAPDISEELNIEWERSFEINDYQAQVKILENGDIQVSEIFEYDFDGDFNGIIRTIGIRGSDGFKYFKASEYFPEDKELEYTQSLAADMVTYKIYDKSSNEKKSFLLEYQLKNIIALYNDTAEFYWKFFDESNTSPIGHVKIEVELPGKITKEELKVFGHGPLDGEASIQEDGKIVYEVYELSSGEMVEVRILFPTNLVPYSIKKFNENKFAEIIEEESGSIETLEEEITEISSSENYYPLDEGRIWKYQILLKEGGGWEGIFGPESKSGERIVTNFPQRELKGEKVTPRQVEDKIWGSSYTSFWFYIEDQSGVYEFAYQNPEDVEPKIIHDYIIKYPIKVGNIWQEIETSSFKPKISIPVKSTIESINEVVTVPAGTFKGCLKIKTIGFAEKVIESEWLPEEKVRIDREWYKWFAPEIGLIKVIFKEKKTWIKGIASPPVPEFRESTIQLETFK